MSSWIIRATFRKAALTGRIAFIGEEKRREEKRGSADIFRRIDGIARRENFKGMESGPTEMVDPLQKGWIFLQGVFTY
jgi:hypothetical protein